MNKSVGTFDGLDHQSTPEEDLHQIDAHIFFTMKEKLLNPVACYQWHKQKMASLQCSLTGVASILFL